VQQAGEVPAGHEWPINTVETEQTAPRQVALRIAREIEGWIKTRRPLTGRGRPVTADDVMILVQSRGPLFAEVIRALRKLKIPTPGADRLNVTGHIAVMDLLALCDVLLNPADNLQLAALLRSPLFDVSEDDLFDLCQRDERETLWMHGTALPGSGGPAASLAGGARFRAAVRVPGASALCRRRAQALPQANGQ
jgi:ATP-dependent helicase/nuclease subunit A